ncbi:MAG: LPS export ABC transporter periplasmic protein LptC [Muribaculaceae bacterium]|nr:LPS export ABC transporter periplasmic protein LptC [Muribaculaceae bacterium]
MASPTRHNNRSLRRATDMLVAMMLALIVASACTEERKVDVAGKINPKGMPTMATRNISTLISDSGIVQYKIVAPLWKVFEESDTPYWSFPMGLYLEKFDPYFKVIATVAADSAKFFKNQKLWRLDGRVELTQVPKTLFQTEQLFWDQQRGILYSDSFIHIETETHVLEGIGFESDEKLRSYRVIHPQGIFPINSDHVQNP